MSRRATEVERGGSFGRGAWIGLGAGTIVAALAVAAAVVLRRSPPTAPAPPTTSPGRTDASSRIDDSLPTTDRVEESAADLIRAGRLEEARHWHEARFPGELGPEERGRLLLASNEAQRVGSMDEALRCLTLLVESDPDPNPMSLVNRAQLHDQMGHREAALADLDRAEAADGRGGYAAAIAETRCHVLVQLFRFEEARAAARRYAEVGRVARQKHELLAEVHYVEGRLEDALAELERARETGSDALLSTDLAMAHLGLGHRDVALGLLEEAEGQATDPVERNMVIAGQAWAWLHPAAGAPDLERARRHLVRLEKGHPKRPLETCARAVFQSILGDHDRAAHLFGVCGRRWTNYPEFGLHYARSLRALGRIEEADHVRSIAARLRPELAARFE